MRGKLYGIGVGVGNPNQLTLKAINTLKKLDVVVVPEAKKDEGSTAYSIVKDYLKEGVEVIFMEFPMLKNPNDRIESRKTNTQLIEKILNSGKDIGFLTIGDPMTYSTYIYILENIDSKVRVETIAGISSFADISSRLNIPLVIGDESLKIVSLNSKVDIKKEIETADNIVFMKISRDFERLKLALIETGNINNVVLVENAGKEKQKIFYEIEKLEQKDIHYFSTMILKKGGMEQWKRSIS